MERDAELLNVPSEAQSAEDISLPSDAGERKRVLNILAQRRYRRRRRERQSALESIVSRSVIKPQRTSECDPQQANLEETSKDSSGCSTSPSSASSTDIPTDLTELNYDNALWLPNNIDFNNLDLSAGNTSGSSPESLIQLSAFLQDDDVTNTSFADDFQIAVPELDLVRAAYDIANRMQCAQLLLDLNAQSVFHTMDCSSWMFTLPKNLQPTNVQLSIPHHPILDILPWPTVRNKLISMYTLPSAIWPKHPEDGTESSMVRLIYDMEDSGGIRVSGTDPSSEKSWEIDQRFFEAWWWAMDQNVVRNSNDKRLGRGLPLLCLPSKA